MLSHIRCRSRTGALQATEVIFRVAVTQQLDLWASGVFKQANNLQRDSLIVHVSPTQRLTAVAISVLSQTHCWSKGEHVEFSTAVSRQITWLQSQKQNLWSWTEVGVRQTEQLGRRVRISDVDSGELHARLHGSWAARKTKNVNAFMFPNANRALKGWS